MEHQAVVSMYSIATDGTDRIELDDRVPALKISADMFNFNDTKQD